MAHRTLRRTRPRRRASRRRRGRTRRHRPDGQFVSAGPALRTTMRASRHDGRQARDRSRRTARIRFRRLPQRGPLLSGTRLDLPRADALGVRGGLIRIRKRVRPAARRHRRRTPRRPDRRMLPRPGACGRHRSRGPARPTLERRVTPRRLSATDPDRLRPDGVATRTDGGRVPRPVRTHRPAVGHRRRDDPRRGTVAGGLPSTSRSSTETSASTT